MSNGMSIVSHNLQSMFSNRQLGIVSNKKEKSTEKLSSGYRINRAADDAAGLAISEKMRRQIRGLTQGTKNVQDGISLIQVADGALSEVNDMLHRITELSVQAANGTNDEQERDSIQSEINGITREIDRISSDTEFNGIKIFAGQKKKIAAPDSPDSGEPSVGNIDDVPPETPPVTDTAEERISQIQSSFSVTGTPVGFSAGAKEITADENGIRIDTFSIPWSAFKKGGESIDINSPADGSYWTAYHGLNIGFSLPTETSLSDIIHALDGAGFNINVSSKTTTPITFSNLTVSAAGPKTDELLAFCQSRSADSQKNDTKLAADEEGITLMAYDQAARGYTNELSRVLWSDMGLPDQGNQGGNYTFLDSATGLTFDFSVASGAAREEVIAAINGAVFDTVYSSPHLTVSSDNISKTPEASGKVNVSSAEIEHNTTHGDFYDRLGYTTPSSKLGGIDVEIYLKKVSGKPAIEFVSNGNSFTETLNTSKTDNYSGTISVFGGYSNSVVTLQTATPGSATSTAAKTQAMLDFLDQQGGYVKLADMHVKDYFEYKMTPFQSVTSQVYSVNNVHTKPYVPATEPDPDPGQSPTQPEPEPGETSGSGQGDEERGDLSLWIQSGAEADDGMYVTVERMNTSILGVNNLAVNTEQLAGNAIEKAKRAGTILSAQRAHLGAQQNRLEHTLLHQENTIENTTRAESLIRDTDMAGEMMNLSAANIIQQAGQSMLSQANQSNQGVMTLLQ